MDDLTVDIVCACGPVYSSYVLDGDVYVCAVTEPLGHSTHRVSEFYRRLTWTLLEDRRRTARSR